MIAITRRAAPPGRKLEFACFKAAFHPRILSSALNGNRITSRMRARSGNAIYCEIMTRNLGRGHAQQQGWYMMMRAKRRIIPSRPSSCTSQSHELPTTQTELRLVFKHPGQAIELDIST
jgi:hypothetical protein